MSKLDCTSETAIAVVFLVINLEKWLASLLFPFNLLLRRFSVNDNSRIQDTQAPLGSYKFATVDIE
jgi:hypothetical protein